MNRDCYCTPLRPSAQLTWWISLGLLLIGNAPVARAEPPARPIEIAYLWQSQPQLDFEWLVEETVPIVRPTVSQLLSPHASERLAAAQSIIRVPNSPGFNRVKLLEGLMQRLQQGESDALLRAALIAAACQLDDGQHAKELWSIAQSDLIARPIIEAACVTWKNAAPIDAWRERVRTRASNVNQQDLLRAVEGLAVTGDQSDLPAFQEMLFDWTITEPLRLATARAVGQLSHEDPMPLVQKLKSNVAPKEPKSTPTLSISQYGLDDVLAVALLHNAENEPAKQFVDGVLASGTPLAQRVAYEWSCRHNPSSAQKLARQLSSHADAEIRKLAILRIEEANNADTLPVLFERLDDLHPKNRILAREQLLDSANRSAERRAEVCTRLAANLEVDQWRSLEQCIRLSVELQQAQHVERLIKLLSHKRPEVCITAAWALRNLATEESTFAAMLEHANFWAARFVPDVQGDVPLEYDYRRVAHLLEAFGEKRYAPSKDLLLKFVPKVGGTGLICRMCGTWACGKMWEHEKNPALVTELHARIADKNALFAEPVSYRYCATLALGWIADPESREPLKDNDEPAPSPIRYGTEWALGRLKD